MHNPAPRIHFGQELLCKTTDMLKLDVDVHVAILRLFRLHFVIPFFHNAVLRLLLGLDHDHGYRWSDFQ